MQIDEENKEQILRNPSVDFTGLPNLAVQIHKTIAQEVADMERAGRAIMIANADMYPPEVEGMPLYPDPIEAEILRREVNGELLIARKRYAEEQETAQRRAAEQQEKNNKELERYQKYVEEMNNKGLPAPSETPTGA